MSDARIRPTENMEVAIVIEGRSQVLRLSHANQTGQKEDLLHAIDGAYTQMTHQRWKTLNISNIKYVLVNTFFGLAFGMQLLNGNSIQRNLNLELRV